jgi:flagellar hook-basal body complex protein FliE
MNISPLQPASIQPISPIEIGGAAPASRGSDFSNILQGAINLEFDMLMQVRNKVVSAYQEVMRMQM